MNLERSAGIPVVSRGLPYSRCLPWSSLCFLKDSSHCTPGRYSRRPRLWSPMVSLYIFLRNLLSRTPGRYSRRPRETTALGDHSSRRAQLRETTALGDHSSGRPQMMKVGGPRQPWPISLCFFKPIFPYFSYMFLMLFLYFCCILIYFLIFSYIFL